jgi:hypothetical protein
LGAGARFSIDMVSLTGKSMDKWSKHFVRLARQGIHIHRINAENINQSPVGDSSCETPYGF